MPQSTWPAAGRRAGRGWAGSWTSGATVTLVDAAARGKRIPPRYASRPITGDDREDGGGMARRRTGSTSRTPTAWCPTSWQARSARRWPSRGGPGSSPSGS
ncbi:hypothetical protein HBB16_03460 [Pseudonocardia sp. MCCB 268]|nr:hypothetical protein [Pseudonocardia cytotoxica]